MTGPISSTDLVFENGANINEFFESRQSQMVEDIWQLCAQDSPSNDIPLLRRCADLIDDYVASMTGVRSRRLNGDDGRPHLRFDFGSRTDVLLICHLDTVYPAGVAADSLRIHDGRLYGCGTMDMKGGIVIAVEALAALLSSQSTANVTLLINSDEEIGSATSKSLISDLAATAEAVLVFEFTDLTGAIKTSRRGVTQYRVSVRGKGGHAAYPELHANPLSALPSVLAAVAALHDPENALCVSPTKITGSERSNVVADVVTVDVDVRGLDQCRVDKVGTTLASLALFVPGVTVEVKTLLAVPSYPPDGSGDLFRLAQGAAFELGIAPLLEIEGRGASDANNAAKTNLRVLDGLGAAGEAAHSLGDECLLIGELPKRAALVALMLSRLLGGRDDAVG